MVLFLSDFEKKLLSSYNLEMRAVSWHNFWQMIICKTKSISFRIELFTFSSTVYDMFVKLC